MNHNSHFNHATCSTKNAHRSVSQTISEMDWERGLWNAEKNLGKTLGLLIAFSGDEEKVKLLIDKARNTKEIVNTPDNAGYTPLHYAARNGHVNICAVLLKYGAYIDAETNSGKATPLHKAAAAGKSNTVKFLIDSGAVVDKQDVDGQTALHKAIQNKRLNIVNILTNVCPQISGIKDFKGNLPNELS